MDVGNPLRSPEYDQMLVRFNGILQDSLLSGRLLRYVHQGCFRKGQLAESKNSGTVTVTYIGQSADEFLNPLLQGHGTVTETERLTVSVTKSVARSRMLEIQSTPRSKDVDSVTAINCMYFMCKTENKCKLFERLNACIFRKVNEIQWLDISSNRDVRHICVRGAALKSGARHSGYGNTILQIW